MSNPNNCCEQVRDSGAWPSYHQCSRKGTIEREGKLYCKTHDPVEVQRRKDANRSAFTAKMYSEERAGQEKEHRAATQPALLAAAKRCLPDEAPLPGMGDGQVYCELTVGDMRALRAAIAAAEEPK